MTEWFWQIRFALDAIQVVGDTTYKVNQGQGGVLGVQITPLTVQATTCLELSCRHCLNAKITFLHGKRAERQMKVTHLDFTACIIEYTRRRV